MFQHHYRDLGARAGHPHGSRNAGQGFQFFGPQAGFFQQPQPGNCQSDQIGCLLAVRDLGFAELMLFIKADQHGAQVLPGGAQRYA